VIATGVEERKRRAVHEARPSRRAREAEGASGRPWIASTRPHWMPALTTPRPGIMAHACVRRSMSIGSFLGCATPCAV